MASPPNPVDYIAIKNTLARYCIALDTKDWHLLETAVFTPDAQADYPFNRDMRGVDVISKAIQGRLQHITSQHSLTTQIVEIQPDGVTAKATTYFTGIHFGRGKWEGQQITAWGHYMDTLKLVNDNSDSSSTSTPAAVGTTVPGASPGKWLISRRTVGFTGRLGEERVMEGE